VGDDVGDGMWVTVR